MRIGSKAHMLAKGFRAATKDESVKFGKFPAL